MRRASLLLPLLAACATPGEQPAGGGGSAPYGRTPDAHQRYQEAAARGEVRIGMVKDEVRTALGPPTRTSRTTYQRKSATCWSYLYRDIYFDNDGFVIGYRSAIG